MEGASYKAHFHLPWRNRRPSPSDQQQKSRKEAARESLHHQHMRLLNMFPLKIKNRYVCCVVILCFVSPFPFLFLFLFSLSGFFFSPTCAKRGVKGARQLLSRHQLKRPFVALYSYHINEFMDMLIIRNVVRKKNPRSHNS